MEYEPCHSICQHEQNKIRFLEVGIGIELGI